MISFHSDEAQTVGGTKRDATGNHSEATHEVAPFSASTAAEVACVALMDW